MGVDKDFILNALLGHNFFPTQRKAKEEIPPNISSALLTPAIASELVKHIKRKNGCYQGYDAIDYRLTRFNGVARCCSIPHPTAYAQLALYIHEQWEHLSYITNNTNSIIRPREHKDGRIIIMNYDKTQDSATRRLKQSFGCRFMARADISNFYPSIYSHAIPWATVGFHSAKIGKRCSSEWFNVLDKAVRHNKRNETNGVAIGPATSNIISELILARIDSVLEKDFSFIRFIDDYTAFCKTEDQAQLFIRRLAEELTKYKLQLNIKKTEVVNLPQSLSDDWLTELSLSLPKGTTVSEYEAVNFINRAVALAKRTPDGSVLKYALKSIICKNLSPTASISVMEYAVNLAYYQPALTPLLQLLFKKQPQIAAIKHANHINELIIDNAEHRRSDSLSWCIYFANNYTAMISDDAARCIVESRDCIPLLLLSMSNEQAHKKAVVDFVNTLDFQDLYELDQYWLLLYELYISGAISNPYNDDSSFETLRLHKVTFTT